MLKLRSMLRSQNLDADPHLPEFFQIIGTHFTIENLGTPFLPQYMKTTFLGTSSVRRNLKGRQGKAKERKLRLFTKKRPSADLKPNFTRNFGDLMFRRGEGQLAVLMIFPTNF